MALKIKTKSSLTAEVTLRCGAVVTVRRLTPEQQRDLYRSYSDERPNRDLGRMERSVNEEKAAEAQPDAYIAGWKNLRPEMLEALGIETDEAPEVDGDGAIPYSKDTARLLWKHADFDAFARDIVRTSERMLELQALAKKNASLSFAA